MPSGAAGLVQVATAAEAGGCHAPRGLAALAVGRRRRVGDTVREASAGTLLAAQRHLGCGLGATTEGRGQGAREQRAAWQGGGDGLGETVEADRIHDVPPSASIRHGVVSTMDPALLVRGSVAEAV
jgi:hypothetical protein